MLVFVSKSLYIMLDKDITLYPLISLCICALCMC